MTTPDEGQDHASYVLVDPWTGDRCAIDAGLVDLITQLWRLGVRTRYCCQGEPGDLASVTIYDAESATRLVGLLGYSHARQLGSRVSWDGVRRPRHTSPRWRWEVRPRSPGPGEWLLQMTLYMPIEDARAAARHLAETEVAGVKAEPAGGRGLMERWRSKAARDLVRAVRAAGGTVQRAGRGRLRITGPAGVATIAEPGGETRRDLRSSDAQKLLAEQTGLDFGDARP